MLTVQELKVQAVDYCKKLDYLNASSVFFKIYETEATEDNGYMLARCLRKSRNLIGASQLIETLVNKFNTERINNEILIAEFVERWEHDKNEFNGKALLKCYRKTKECSDAYNFYDTLMLLFPNSKGIQLAKLWVDYSCKIKDWANDNLLRDAEQLLLQTDKYNEYTCDIFNKTVLNVAKYQRFHQNYTSAIEWLEKLDFTILKKSPFNFNGRKFPSDQKEFFIRYADALIELNKHAAYVEECLGILNFNEKKQAQFKNKIINDSTFDNYVSRTILGLYLKYLKDEIFNRKQNSFQTIYNVNKITLISDLAQFEFCPVSFAINETYSVSSNVSWELDEWIVDKKYLIDRYNEYQKTKNINEIFKDSAIEINDSVKNDFNDILNSKLVINNFDGSNQNYFSNSTDRIRGNPDYVFETIDKKRFAVVEKFTKRIAENTSAPFSNDLVKLYGYIFELATLNLDYGLLIYWHWHYEDVPTKSGTPKKQIRIKSYRIYRIEKTSEIKNKLANTIEKLIAFKETKQFSVDGDKISYPNKCLHCSVVSYCNHKTGQYNVVKLPYVINEPPIPNSIATNFTSNYSNTDDLPF